MKDGQGSNDQALKQADQALKQAARDYLHGLTTARKVASFDDAKEALRLLYKLGEAAVLWSQAEAINKVEKKEDK